jgi:predicted transcriptional regulator
MARHKQRTQEEIKKEILDYVENLTFPTTSTNIAQTVRLNWYTVKKYLDELKDEGKLYLRKVGRQNQWWTGNVCEEKKLARKTLMLEKEIVRVEENNIELKRDNIKLKSDNLKLKEDNLKLKEETEETAKLKEKIEELKKRILDVES